MFYKDTGVDPGCLIGDGIDPNGGADHSLNRSILKNPMKLKKK